MSTATADRTSRLTLRQKLLLIGAAGVVLTLVVVQSALAGLGEVNRDDQGEALFRRAQRLHQEADMGHDALHSDVHETLLVSTGQVPSSSEETLLDLGQDADVFERDVDEIAGLHLSGPVGKVLADARPLEVAYVAHARRLGQLAFTDQKAAIADLASFERQFRQVEIALADVTARVAKAADEAGLHARREATAVQHRILVASLAALVGLLTLAAMLNRLGSQLADTLAQLHAQVEAVVRSDQRSKDFLAYAAHQLRTPITATRASAEALLVRGAPVEQEDLLAAVIRETGRAGRLVGDLLRVARLDQGEVPVGRLCDPRELCRHELERMQARGPSLRWRLETDEQVPERVWLSPEATQEALANLLDNARRHARSTVTMRLGVEAGGLAISVLDDGPGLPETDGVSAFERFVSLDGQGGSGLGLPIARGLAEAQGGRLDHEGGRFVLTLPLRPAEAAGREEVPEDGDERRAPLW